MRVMEKFFSHTSRWNNFFCKWSIEVTEFIRLENIFHCANARLVCLVIKPVYGRESDDSRLVTSGILHSPCFVLVFSKSRKLSWLKHPHGGLLSDIEILRLPGIGVCLRNNFEKVWADLEKIMFNWGNGWVTVRVGKIGKLLSTIDFSQR